MRVPLLRVCILLLASTHLVVAQDSLTVIDKVINFPNKFLERINNKAVKLEDKLLNYSEKALAKLEKQEQKLRKKLAKKDSLAAKQVFGDVSTRYQELRQQFSQKENQFTRYKQYIPAFDTLKTSLNFLSQNSQTFFSNSQQVVHLNNAMKSIKGLEGKLQSAENIRKYLKERRLQLHEQIDKFGMIRDLKKYNKEVYYYSQQLKEYKAMLNDPGKLQRRAFKLLQKLPAVRQFFEEHSELASLFNVPDNYGSSQSLQGLQTRADVQAMIDQRIQSGGPNAQSMIQQNIQQAQQQLTSLKERIHQLGGNSSDADLPDFKPNSQKTKSLWQRFEFGTNMQNTRSSNFFPTTTDLGLSMGFKLNDISILGIGASYKIGWGKDLNHISITHEGIGVRSFIDWKLKGSFYLSGGYEQNYRSRFYNLQQLRTLPANWTQSGLLGLNKKYSIGKKWKGEVKLLFDFLYQNHIPQTQPILFRIGYSF